MSSFIHQDLCSTCSTFYIWYVCLKQTKKKVLFTSFLTVKVKLVVTIVSEVLIPVKGRQTEEALNALQDWQRVLYELVTVQDQDVLLVDNYMEIFIP